MLQGFHNITAATYHMDPCAQPSLSSSIAKILLRESPRKAWFSHPRLNPNHREEHESKFDLGTCAHAVLLENDPSKIVVVEADDWRTKVAKETRDAARAAGKTPLLARHYAEVRAMVDVAIEYLKVCEITEYWNQGESEVTGVWRENDIWLRCRFDRLSLNKRCIMDYKTTDSAAPDVFSRQITRMGYHIQDAFYRRGLRALGTRLPAFVFLVQECEPPYECALHDCDAALQEIADAEVERSIQLWRACFTKKYWPSYGGRIHTALPPAYLMAEHEERLLEGADIGWKERVA